MTIPSSADYSFKAYTLLHVTGFQMTLFQYHTQIRTLLQQMHTAQNRLCQLNRVFADAFLGEFPFKHLDNLLSGFRSRFCTTGHGTGMIGASFSHMCKARKRGLKDQLEAFQYSIDASNSLLLIMGLG